MSHVFISYVRENAEAVQRLHDALTSRGIEVWLDKTKINPGVFWKEAIRKAISEGSFFIACFSKEYYDRDNTYMNEELTLAIDELRKRRRDRVWFIPVKLSKCEIPDWDICAGKTLRNIHWVELYVDWDAGIQEILRSIEQPNYTHLVEERSLIDHDENWLVEKKTWKVIYKEHEQFSKPKDWSIEFMYPDQEISVPSRVVVSQLPKTEGFTEHYLTLFMPDQPPQLFFKGEGESSTIEIDTKDFDGDGIPEIAVLYSCGAHSRGFRLFRISRKGKPRMVPGTDLGSDWPSIEWGDFDRDGRYEIIIKQRNWSKVPTRDMIQEKYIWNGKEYYLDSEEFIDGTDEE